MGDDLEQRPVPRGRPRRSRKPPPQPKRVPEALKSLEDLEDDQVYTFTCRTLDDAKKEKSAMVAAVRWLNNWGWKVLGKAYNLRVAPYIDEVYLVGDEEIYGEDFDAVNSAWDDHYWVVSYRAHPPLKRGLAIVSAETQEKVRRRALERKAELGLVDVSYLPPSAPKRRSVQIRATGPNEATG